MKKDNPAEELSKRWRTAIDSNRVASAVQLLKNDKNIEVRDRDGRTPLINASCAGALEIVRLLVEEGADVNASDNRGWTSLHFAAQGGNVELATLLIRAKATVDAKDENGNTPLCEAVFSCNGDSPEDGALIRLLVKAGAKKGLKNKFGVSPLGLAKDIGNFDVTKHFK